MEPEKFQTFDQISAAVLQQGPSPKDCGTVTCLFRRPAKNIREVLSKASFTFKDGVVGDNWLPRGHYSTADGAAKKKAQIALMNSRILKAIEPSGNAEREALAGDQLLVDFDLSEQNLNVGDRILIGKSDISSEHIILEITDESHTGCSKFSHRYGDDALKYTRTDPRGRGVYATVFKEGTVHVGDSIQIVFKKKNSGGCLNVVLGAVAVCAGVLLCFTVYTKHIKGNR